jgi:hypothetical protein
MPKESSHMDLNQDYFRASSVHMQNNQEIGLRYHASQSVLQKVENNCGNLPQCKTDNSHRVAKVGDIYTLQIVAWP